MLAEHIQKIATAPAIDFDCADVEIKRSDKAPIAVGVDFATNEVPAEYVVITTNHANAIGDLRRQLDTLAKEGNTAPVIIKMSYPASMSTDEITVAASVDLGSLLLDGYADGIWLDAPTLSAEAIKSLSLSILQATRRRISKTEYIACPSCGRTLFNLTEVLQEIKRATSHLRGLKIGVMGCIVNGPGEMADADYGYVGAAVGNVSLYKGKQCVIKNIPAEEALPQLINLIKENGDWIDENTDTPC
jgi:(E)-4-hydroxy-3-methylbut-2-enyl-diphosphate synthase